MNLPSITSQAYEMHFLVGIVIGLLFKRDWVWIVILVALGKELFDLLRHGKPDIMDFMFTVIGSLFVWIYRALRKGSYKKFNL